MVNISFTLIYFSHRQCARRDPADEHNRFCCALVIRPVVVAVAEDAVRLIPGRRVAGRRLTEGLATTGTEERPERVVGMIYGEYYLCTQLNYYQRKLISPKSNFTMDNKKQRLSKPQSPLNLRRTEFQSAPDYFEENDLEPFEIDLLPRNPLGSQTMDYHLRMLTMFGLDGEPIPANTMLDTPPRAEDIYASMASFPVQGPRFPRSYSAPDRLADYAQRRIRFDTQIHRIPNVRFDPVVHQIPIPEERPRVLWSSHQSLIHGSKKNQKK